jgi:hypothetical protein
MRRRECDQRVHDWNKLLRWEYRVPGYADWLYGKPEAVPENPTPEIETAALKAFLRGFDHAYSDPPRPILLPDQPKEGEPPETEQIKELAPTSQPAVQVPPASQPLQVRVLLPHAGHGRKVDMM